MKHKILALILALAVTSWAQTSTPNAASPQQNPAPAEKAKCPCCEKMASASTKDAHSCCAHHDMKADAKEMSCCNGKDAKCCGDKDAMSCMKGAKDAASCCDKNCGTDKAAADCCGGNCKHCENGSCKKKEEKAASNCCGGEQKSERDPAHNYAALGK